MLGVSLEGLANKQWQSLCWGSVGSAFVPSLVFSAIFFFALYAYHREHSLLKSSKNYFVCHSPWSKLSRQTLAVLIKAKKVCIYKQPILLVFCCCWLSPWAINVLLFNLKRDYTSVLKASFFACFAAEICTKFCRAM
jgi:hypothetical protein